MKKIFLATMVTALLSACCSSRSAQSARRSIVGEWTVEWIEGFENVAVEGEGTPAVTFESDKYYSYTGCNRLSGSLQLDGQNIKFGDGPMTKMACNDRGREQKFMEAIFAADNFVFDGDALLLRSGQKTVMRLAAKSK